MKILINENQYNLLVERLGVPNKIINTAEEFYNQIINNLNRPDKYISDETVFLIHGDFQIDKYKFNRFKVVIFFTTWDKTKKLVFYKGEMGIKVNIEKIKNAYREFNNFLDESNSQLNLHFASPNDNASFDEIKNVLINQKSKIIGDISHELMHFYEVIKNKSRSMYSGSLYGGYGMARIGIKPVDKMMYYLYYISKIENITRPSEIFGILKTKNIKKQDFKSFLNNNKMYENLIEMRNFNIDVLINDLKNNYIDEIDNFLIKTNLINELSVEQKINLVFNALYEEFKTKTIEDFIEYFKTKESITNEMNDIIRKFGVRLSRQNNYINYFRKKQKEINYSADKMIKKISKLYDLLPD